MKRFKGSSWVLVLRGVPLAKEGRGLAKQALQSMIRHTLQRVRQIKKSSGGSPFAAGAFSTFEIQANANQRRESAGYEGCTSPQGLMIRALAN